MDHQVCAECGIEFAAPTHWTTKRREDGKTFYCPNGHSLSFGEGTNEKLRRQRDRLQQQLAAKDDEIAAQQKEVAARDKKIKKMQKRALAGTCPCCSRTFSNMTRHMRNKHPDFAWNEIPEDAKASATQA